MADPKKPAVKRAAPGPKAIYVILKEGAPKDAIVKLARKTDEVLEYLDTNPGSSYRKFLMEPQRRSKPQA